MGQVRALGDIFLHILLLGPIQCLMKLPLSTSSSSCSGAAIPSIGFQVQVHVTSSVWSTEGNPLEKLMSQLNKNMLCMAGPQQIFPDKNLWSLEKRDVRIPFAIGSSCQWTGPPPSTCRMGAQLHRVLQPVASQQGHSCCGPHQVTPHHRASIQQSLNPDSSMLLPMIIFLPLPGENTNQSNQIPRPKQLSPRAGLQTNILHLKQCDNPEGWGDVITLPLNFQNTEFHQCMLHQVASFPGMPCQDQLWSLVS